MAENIKELEAQIAALMAENANLKAKAPKAPGLTCKVSAKGAMSVYGIGRFPVTLYRSQWENLFSHSDKLVEFLKANEASLKTKE